MRYALLFLFFFPLYGVTQEEAFNRLIIGNKQFAKGESGYAKEERTDIIAQQNPFAIILSCSDSRLPPESIFNQRLGDLFVVRVAGNVAGPIELQSIEYAVLHLHPRLLVVLGHENCGAVTATLTGDTQDIETIAELIRQAVTKGEALQQAVKANVKNVIRYLQQTPHLKSLIDQGKIEIKGGYYSMQTGLVTWL